MHKVGRDIDDEDLRAQALVYHRLARLIRARAEWPESVYKTGYARLSLADAETRELGQLLLTPAHYWGLRNA